MKNTYRWGILGAGKIAEKFASALNYTDGASVSAIASRDEGRGKAFAERHGASRVYTDYHKLALDPEIDIVYIALPHAFHCEQALHCLQHKKPVLCEKPMALNLEQVNRLADAAHRNQTFLMEGMWSRFMPSICKMLDWIKEDIIGQVLYVRADFGFEAPLEPQGRLFNLELGGGSLLDVGIYTVFLTTLVLGEPVRVQSMARLGATGADEYCSMQFQYAGGEVASLFSSITIRTPLTAEISGSKGRILLQCPFYKATSISLELFNGERNELHFPHEHNGFEYQIREVMACLDRGYMECPLMPLDFSLRMARTIEEVKGQCGIVY
ncbi:MAG: Gfo/Idh/MocA family oxidoreductase [Chitinophagaceae bacterium]